MKEYLFVYGTLLPERSPQAIAACVRRLSFVGEASVRGYLYDLGEYPGAVLDDETERKIIGRVFALPDDPTVLRALDDYEGFNPNDSENSLFLRQQTHVTLGDRQ